MINITAVDTASARQALACRCPLHVTYDTYDNKTGSLNTACSNGWLASRFPTFGDIPSFPFTGGVFDTAWSSPNCGVCCAVTKLTTGSTINFTVVDTGSVCFHFNKLAGGQLVWMPLTWERRRFRFLTVVCRYSTVVSVTSLVVIIS
jgi:hypothetical protein